MAISKNKKKLLPIAPGIIGSSEWRFALPPLNEWRRVRKVVLERDKHTCRFCGHQAEKHMHVHHRHRGDVHLPRNLITCCAACHATQHIGRSLVFGSIEIWKSELTQLQIIRKTRRLVKQGLSLGEIKKQLKLRRGELPCKSVEWANVLLNLCGDQRRMSLPNPYRAVFVKFKTWQV